ncbi:hypothetical protein HYV88_01605 [Candidatus Woesearchaeota archaeon]|nr:hypothetical protein [Candidatus Woesearchaeota archaeon]
MLNLSVGESSPLNTLESKQRLEVVLARMCADTEAEIKRRDEQRRRAELTVYKLRPNYS